jgi:hypothetical protein
MAQKPPQDSQFPRLAQERPKGSSHSLPLVQESPQDSEWLSPEQVLVLEQLSLKQEQEPQSGLEPLRQEQEQEQEPKLPQQAEPNQEQGEPQELEPL